MDHRIDFVKLSGSGNDFICIDNRDGRLDPVLSPQRVGQFARTICRRGLGIGADGIIFASKPEVDGVADVAATFLEPDGSEAELCGNGTACFTRWGIDNGWARGGELRVLTPAGVVRGRIAEDFYVRVCIPLPEDVRRDLSLQAEGGNWLCDYALTGVPHLVTYMDDVSQLDMDHVGPSLRRHEAFGPRGVNVNFAQVLGEGELALRTFEFGVEGETLACGTGAATASVLSAVRFGWGEPYRLGKQPVLVHVRGGDVLRVFLTLDAQNAVTDLCLDSVVRYNYTGSIHPHLLTRALAEQ